ITRIWPIFLIASVSLAAKALGDLRTDHEFESRMFVSREKLADAEERIIKSFGVQDSILPFPDLVSQLTKRQIESMADGFAERGLVSSNEREELVRRSYDYLDSAVEKGLGPKMSYRGRAAGVMLKAVRDLGLEVPEIDIEAPFRRINYLTVRYFHLSFHCSIEIGYRACMIVLLE